MIRELTIAAAIAGAAIALAPSAAADPGPMSVSYTHLTLPTTPYV